MNKFFEQINIGSKFDAKGFKQAETALSKLGKNAKRIGGTLGVAFGTAAIVSYGKASIKAFAEDERAAAGLAKTIDNLGLSNQIASSTLSSYINNLEQTSAVVDDELRPALDRLLRATGNVAKSQELLGLALDISGGTGKSLAQVSQSLQKAYLGQTQALGRLGVGLSKSELASGDFEKIQKRLTVLFKGQAKVAADSYEGSLKKLTIASNNAKEVIGGGLIQSLQMLGGEDGVGRTTKAIDELSLALSESLVAATKLVLELKKIPLVGGFIQRLTSNPLSLPKEALVFGKGGLLDYFRNYGKSQGGFPQGLPADLANLQAAMAQYLKKNTKPTVDNTAALKKLTDKFDLKKIGLAAALANPNISDDTRNRLRSLQAIENGDDAGLLKYGSLVKPNASMKNPNATVVNIYPQGNVLTEQDLVTYIQDGLQTQSRRRGGGKLGPLIL
jgi:hypothetical protein